MKNIKKILYLLTGLFLLPAGLLAQDCVDYHNVGDCMLDRQKGFKIYSQSKSVSMDLLDTVELNLVFYGQKDYILSFCAHRKMYPIHFVIIDPESGQAIYDNDQDKFIESLGIGFDVTRTMTIKANVLARKSTEEEIENFQGCLGLLIQYRNYQDRKVTLKMH